jgi:hypothetical protein
LSALGRLKAIVPIADGINRLRAAESGYSRSEEEVKMSTKAILGGVLAYILLILYVYLVWVAISVVYCTPQPVCQEDFNKGMASALALIGGLVSALVIAELALTKRDEAPLARALAPNASASTARALKFVTFGYLAIWVLAGLAALIVGWRHPEAHQPLVDLGQSWLGLAVAAGYAYFGINPQD